MTNQLPGVPEPAGPRPETARAQDYLNSAIESVVNTKRAVEIVRQVSIDEGRRSATGRATNEEMDLRRMAIVFAAGAVDASLKRLLRDALVPIATASTLASSEFETFAERTLRGREDLSVDHKELVRILTSDAASPRDALLDLYVEARTSGSLQSVEEVVGVCRALGIDDKSLVKRITRDNNRMRRLFEARNQVVHELDLQEVGQGTRRRRDRAKKFTEEVTTEALAVTQEIINAVAVALTN